MVGLWLIGLKRRFETRLRRDAGAAVT